MKIAVDTHTHSIASGHAYSTIDELARAARRHGLKGFVITEHGPALQGFPHKYYFGNLRVLPPKIHGVRVFHGAELNIMDGTGAVDLDRYYAERLDFVMAGFHEACFESRSLAENTKVLIAALGNPLVDGISHPGNPVYPIDFGAVAAAAASLGKTLEINDSSFRVRKGSDKTCPELAAACQKHGTLVTCGSDAHTAYDIGRTGTALGVIKSVGIDRAKVVNLTLDGFTRFSAERKGRRLGQG
jgi:putative hydrolase